MNINIYSQQLLFIKVSTIHPIPPIRMVNYFLQKLTTIKKEEDFHSFYVISGFHNQAKQFLNGRPRFISSSGKNVHPFAFHPRSSFFSPRSSFFSVCPSVRFESKPSAVCKWQKRGQPALGLSRARCFTCTLLLNVAVVISIIISVTRGCSAN